MFALPGCDCSKSFLSCGIPYLQLDGFTVQFNSSDLKIDANSADITLSIGVISESKEETGLADAGVADQQQLEQIVTAKIKKNS